MVQTLQQKLQLKRYSRLELIKDQYPTSAVGILRGQAEEMPLMTSFPLQSHLRVFPTPTLGHLRHSLDSNCLSVPETLQSSSYSESLLAIPNTTTCSFYPSTSPDISSEACSKTSTSTNSAPSNPNSTPMSSRYSWGCNGDRAAPMASDIKGHVIRVMCNIKG